MNKKICVYLDNQLAAYGFGPNHPFSNARYDAFANKFHELALEQVVQIGRGRYATEEELLRFHTRDYINFVKQKSDEGIGYLDYGDTPARPGIYEAACYVVGTVLEGVDQIMTSTVPHSFIPIAGLHHAHRDAASGFCVFNDCAIAIHTLRQKYNLKKIAYVDIDVHHGDGVFYAFETDPDLIFADIHQVGIFPGTGSSSETGEGQAAGHKLNIPLSSGAGDQEFLEVWPMIEELLDREKPEFIILQCGADSLANDPLAFFRYSEQTHAYVAERLSKLANRYTQGRLLALGGGGYNLDNIARAWNAVIQSLIKD